mgnify:CR=1 FL=1
MCHNEHVDSKHGANVMKNLESLDIQGIQPNGGGALSSNVSKLGSKEVSKKLRNYPLAPWGEGVRRTGEGSRVEGKCAFTLAEGATHVDTCDGKRKIAFTLAEVLITLGIIGVVASLTLPSVIHQYRKKALETQFKTAYSFINQAIVMTKQDLGSNSLFDDYTVYNSKQGYVYANEFKKAFYKRLKVVGSATLKSTDYSIYSNGNIKRYTSGDRFTFETPEKLLENGMTLYATINGSIDGKRVLIVVDINGNKGPNRAGHDLFIFKINDSSDKLIGAKKIRDYTEDELGDLSSGGINNLLGMPCSRYSKQSANGEGCTWYAINNICPDDETKGYWECLPR